MINIVGKADVIADHTISTIIQAVVFSIAAVISLLNDSHCFNSKISVILFDDQGRVRLMAWPHEFELSL